MSIIFGVSDVCSAFKDQTIGSKVLKESQESFLNVLKKAIHEHDNSKDRAPGQHFIVLTDRILVNGQYHVSAGDGPKSDNPEDYVVRHHREGPKMFLKREKAGDVQFLACVVYTREAYLADPDVTKEEAENLGDATHVIVAVIASSGPAAPVTPFRFVHNLAGGNNEYKAPKFADYPEHKSEMYLVHLEEWAEFVTKKAEEVKDYWSNYSVVAD